MKIRHLFYTRGQMKIKNRAQWAKIQHAGKEWSRNKPKDKIKHKAIPLINH